MLASLFLFYLYSRSHIVCLQLPKAVDATAAEEAARKSREAEEARRRHEQDAAALRAQRMALRDIVTGLLGRRRWTYFAEPKAEEDDEYWHKVCDLSDSFGNITVQAKQVTSILGSILARVTNPC